MLKRMHPAAGCILSKPEFPDYSLEETGPVVLNLCIVLHDGEEHLKLRLCPAERPSGETPEAELPSADASFWYTFEELKTKTDEETANVSDWKHNPMAAIPVWIAMIAQK